jgi:phage RecT family recombinase
MSNSAIEKKQDSTVQAIKIWAESDAFADDIGKALPAAIREEDRDHWIAQLGRCLVTQVQKNPKLQQCSRRSLGLAVLQLVEFGLMPNGYDAHLVPYNTKQADGSWKLEASLIVDYKGFTRLLYDYVKAKSVDAQVVYEGDHFRVKRTAEGDELEHEPVFPRVGQPIAVYSRVVLPNDRAHIHVMDIADVESKRQRSKSFKNGGWEGGPNATDPDDMRKRTCLKNHMKFLPRSDEFSRLLEMDNRHDPIEDEQRQAATKEVEVNKIEAVRPDTSTQVKVIEGLLKKGEFSEDDLAMVLRQHHLLQADQSWRELPPLVLDSVIERFEQLFDFSWETKEQQAQAKKKTAKKQTAVKKKTAQD